MKKNVSGQKIGVQMVSATDGSAFTSAVTVYITGDAGTQAIGSVGGGALTHEGNGYHTYAPSQAETNYDLIAFTFIGTGAVPVTLQVYATYPQTGDSYAEVTNGTYGLSALKTLIDAIKVKTDALTFSTANKVDATIQAAGDFAQGAADKVWSTAARTLTAFGFSVTVGTNNDKTGYALSSAGVQAIWDALTSALTTVNSIGKRLVDNIDAAISSRLATSGYTTPPTAASIAAAVLVESVPSHAGIANSLAQYVSNTKDFASQAQDNTAGLASGIYPLGPTGNDTTHLNLAGFVNEDDTLIDTLVVISHGGNLYSRWIEDWVNATQLATVAALPFTPTAGDQSWLVIGAKREIDATTTAKLQAHAAGVLTIVVGTGSSPTTVKLSTVNGAAPSSVNDFYNNRVIVLTSGALAGQAAQITDYDGASTTATISGLTAAPANGVTGVIV